MSISPSACEHVELARRGARSLRSSVARRTRNLLFFDRKRLDLARGHGAKT